MSSFQWQSNNAPPAHVHGHYINYLAADVMYHLYSEVIKLLSPQYCTGLGWIRLVQINSISPFPVLTKVICCRYLSRSITKTELVYKICNIYQLKFCIQSLLQITKVPDFFFLWRMGSLCAALFLKLRYLSLFPFVWRITTVYSWSILILYNAALELIQSSAPHLD